MTAAPPVAGPAAAPGAEATSRLCIKNLPKYLSEDRLKKHFAVKGEVTDVKVLKTRDGQPRQMGFVGYRTVEEAAAAVKYFNKSYMDTSRLEVEFARPFRDSSLPRPWSKHSTARQPQEQQKQEEQQQAGSDKASKLAGKKRKAHPDAITEAEAADAKLAEFMALMQPRSKARMWSNDDMLPGDVSVKGAAAIPPAAGPAAAAARPATLKAGAARPAATAADASAQIQPQEQQQEEEDEDDEQGGGAVMGKDVLVMDSAVNDLDYLRSRMRKWDDDDEDEAAAEGMRGQQPQLQGERGTAGALLAAASDSESDGSDVDMEDGSDGGGDDSDDDSDEERDELNALRRGDQSGVGPSPARHKQQGQQLGQQRQRQQQEEEGGDDDMHEQEEDREHEEAGGAGAGVAQQGAYDRHDDHDDGGDGLILDTGRLFVRNLAYGASEADLSELFSRFGDLAEVHLVLDRDTKQSKGLAYVQFQLPEDALAARNALDSTIFQGRLLHILPARRSLAQEREAQAATGSLHGAHPNDEPAGADTLAQAGAPDDPHQQAGANGGFRAEREQQRKRDAGNRAAWNTLFMRADTVAAAVAAHYGVSKAELLDRSASDLPVRMALGEAQVIAQTKQALSAAGVDVPRLEAAAAASGHASARTSIARSSTTLLVKNLPFTADEVELAKLFARCGTVVRLVLPPAKALALVEFAEPQEARTAFKSLAYKKFQNVPLYLEWAPKDIFLEGAPAAAAAAAAAPAATPSTPAATAPEAAPRAAAVVAVGDEDADEDAPTATLFVKNVSFATTDEALAKHFDAAVSAAGGRLHSARVARRKAADGKLLSMGFGFVECDSEEVAKVVLKQLQGSKLDKHALNLQLSKRPAPAANKAAAQKAAAAAKEGAGAKVVVRNVAFEATKKDIMGLFGPFGHVKSCRLPRKFDGQHRGFAFVEFTTKQEAKGAIEGVGGTHLYGRRLVVEYAEAEEGLEGIRAKTAASAAKAKAGGEAAPAAAKRLQATL